MFINISWCGLFRWRVNDLVVPHGPNDFKIQQEIPEQIRILSNIFFQKGDQLDIKMLVLLLVEKAVL